MRREFHMSEEQHARLLKASQPTPVMFLSGGASMFNTPQENANRAWQALGEEMGFNWSTVYPVTGKDDRYFSAEELPK